VIRIKNISYSLLFALRRLGKARHCGVTDIVLATMREYALGLRVVDMNQKKEQDHTMLEQLDKFYLHRYRHPFPQYRIKLGFAVELEHSVLGFLFHFLTK